MNGIDRLVAERVFGKHKLRFLNKVSSDMFDGAEFGTDREWYSEVWWDEETRMPVLNYSTDISAAWGVAQHVVSERHVRFATLEGSHTRPFAEFFDVSTGNQRFSASENTMPLAICIAALRAVGVEESEIQEAMKN